MTRSGCGIGRPIALSGFPARAPVQELIAGTPDVARLRANGLLRTQQLFACSTATERTTELLDAISHNPVSDSFLFVRKVACLLDFVLILTDRARQV